MPAVLTNNNYVEVQLKFLNLGRFMYTNLVYMSTVADEIIDRADCADAINDQWFDSDVIPNIMTPDCHAIEIQVRSRGVEAGFTYTRTQDYPGLTLSQSLPRWLTWSFRVFPDNANLFPIPGAPYTQPFRYGRVQFPGIGESDQDAGIATVGAASRLDAVAAAVKQIDAQGSNGDLALIMARYLPIPPHNTQAFVNVTDVIYNRIGSQNTRK